MRKITINHTNSKSSTETSRKRKSRASLMIEFAIILPLFIFFILFSIDAGRLMLLRAELQDATQQAARAGAQVGGAELNGSTPSRSAFNRAIEYSVGLSQDRVVSFTIVEPASKKCGTGSVSASHVTISSEYSASLVTPGLEALLELATSDVSIPQGGWLLRATSTARCEIAVP